MSAPLIDFAAANDDAAGTASKLAKQAVLAAYLSGLADDDDLRRAVRYAAGRAFPATAGRTLAVGPAIVGDVARDLLGLDARAYHDAVVKAGETGEALSKAWDRRPAPPATPTAESPAAAPAAPPGPPLTLADVSAAFDALADTGVVERKRAVLRDVLGRCRDRREAAYVAKVIAGDLRTGVQEGVLEAAVAAAFGRPLAGVRRAQLLVGDLDEVAVLARHDRLATAAFRLFHPIQFMLATPQETADIAAATIAAATTRAAAPTATTGAATSAATGAATGAALAVATTRAVAAEAATGAAATATAATGEAAGASAAGRPFVAEDKLDGIRAQVHKDGCRIAIYTRTMDRADASFPDVVAAVARLPGAFLLDGEIVPYRDGVVLPFANIQKRLGRKVLSAKTLADHPAAFVPFDLLYRDGTLLMDHPWRDRRAALDDLYGVPPAAAGGTGGPPASPPPGPATGRGSGTADPARPLVPPLRPTPVVTAADIDAAFAASRLARNEGLVLKDPDAPYAPGRRGKAWLKLKTHLPTFDCVVTAAEFGHGKRRATLSDYTFAVWDRDPALPGATLVNLGKAFSGVTDAEIARLTELFLGISTGQAGRVHAVRPQVVLEIAADQVQRSGRHAGGFALRFPRIKRVRWDKRPADADQLARVAEVYASAHNTAHDGHPPPPPEPTLFDGL